MKNKLKSLGIAVLVAVIVFSLIGCDQPTDSPENKTPVAADYDIGNLSQTAGSVTAVTVTAKAGKSPGAVSNIRYNGSTEIPQTEGSYPVTFDVAAATGWKAVSGLSAGTLTVSLNPRTFTGITAVYVPVNPIFTDSHLVTLKDDLTVTANYSDDSTKTLDMEDYELSGELTEGESVITVTYAEGGVTKTDTFTVTVTAAHTHIWGAWYTHVPATCIEKGEERQDCTADPPHHDSREADALGHDYQWQINTTAATCETAAIDTQICSRDNTHIGTTRTGAAALGHDYQWQINTTAATCETAAIDTQICSRDNTHIGTTRTGAAALGHDWGAWTTTTAPGFFTQGEETQTCTRDNTHKETRAVAVKPNITNLTDYNAALTEIRTLGAGSYTMNITGDITGIRPLDAAPTATTGFGTAAVTVTLTGSGILDLANSEGSMFRLASGQTLVIDGAGLTLRGRTTGGPRGGASGTATHSEGNNASVIDVPNGAALELKNGTVSGNTMNNFGGGVSVSGTFTMRGGTISGNTSLISGGGVFVGRTGTFIMHGGTIHGNSGTSPSGRGGGVLVNSDTSASSLGQFIMLGGTISGNTTSTGGGGVYIYAPSGNSSNFRIVNGTIYGSDASAELANIVTVSGGAATAGTPAQYGQIGTFSVPGDITSEWTATSNLTGGGTSNTVTVVNGVRQP